MKRLREEKDWTLKAIAEKCGVSTNTVWRWEQGKQIPGIELLERLADVLGTTVNYLYGQTNDPHPYCVIDGKKPAEMFHGTEITAGHNIIVPFYDLPTMIFDDKDISYFKTLDFTIPLMWVGKLPENNYPFFFVVRGDSMESAGLREGYIALVNPDEPINNGDIVLALIGPRREITVRWCYFLPDDSIELRCSSPHFPVYHFQGPEPGMKPLGVEVVGKIVGAWNMSLKRGM
jgi:transcriptional regulator with XRE-family HTH domain